MPDPRETESTDAPVSRSKMWGLILLAIVYCLIDTALVTVTIPQLQFSSPWNWSGKLLSIGFSGLLLIFSPWLRRNVGLRFRQAPGSWRLSLGCFVYCVAISIVGGLANGTQAFSLDTILYQALMPSLAEELSDRGITLAILERAFGNSPMSCRLRYGRAALITSLWFGIGHIFQMSFTGGHAVFWLNPHPIAIFLFTFLFASLMALTRTRSGSLLWPILCHSASNVPMQLVSMLR